MADYNGLKAYAVQRVEQQEVIRLVKLGKRENDDDLSVVWR
jgi:hypothetical protein